MAFNKKTTQKKNENKSEGKTQGKTVFPTGMRIFEPHSNAPDFVKGSIFIDTDKFYDFISENPQFVHTSEKYGNQLKLQILESKEGSLYLTVDTYKKPE